MPDIKITKQLNRPDGGKISSGSIATSNPQFDENNLMVIFPTFLFLSEVSIENGKKCIPACDELSIKNSMPKRLIKKCTIEEWTKVNVDANAGELTRSWMKILIDEIIGEGFTEII